MRVSARRDAQIIKLEWLIYSVWRPKFEYFNSLWSLHQQTSHKTLIEISLTIYKSNKVARRSWRHTQYIRSYKRILNVYVIMLYYTINISYYVSNYDTLQI